MAKYTYMAEIREVTYTSIVFKSDELLDEDDENAVIEAMDDDEGACIEASDTSGREIVSLELLPEEEEANGQ